MFEKKLPDTIIKRNANQARTSRRWRKIIPASISVAIALLILFYVASLLFMRYGSFTVKVKDFNDRNYALSLCDQENFKKSTTRLIATEIKNVTNITYSNLPENLNDIDGSHNGENYLAYTFYLKNTGKMHCSYKYSLNISRATVGIDSAARVRVYYHEKYYSAETKTYNYNGTCVNYAKPKTGGNGIPESDPNNITPTNFLSDGVITEGQIDGFQVGDISKITVVIWLEGNDPDCTDDILGGQFKVDMLFEIIAGS